MIWIVYVLIVVVLLVYASFGFRILKDYEQAVVFILGKYYRTKNGGLRWFLPFIQSYELVDTRFKNLDLGEQKVFSKEGFEMNVMISVSYKVSDAKKAVNDVDDFISLIKNSVLSSVKDVVSNKNASVVISDRKSVFEKVISDVNKEASYWGIKVSSLQFYDLKAGKDLSKVLSKKEPSKKTKSKKLESDNDDFLLD